VQRSHIIDELSQHMHESDFASGDHLITKGTPGNHMLLIRSGSVRVELDNRNIILSKGAVVGEIALLSGKPRQANVIAETPTKTFILSRDNFQTLMTKHTQLASAMTALMKSRLDADNGFRTVGKYQILEVLGEGGMAIVYNAYDPDLDRHVAIKMLKYEIACKPDFKARFKQEAKTIARFQHPNIVHVFETIEAYATAFIVMEKLQGEDLKQHMQKHGAFDSQQTCRILQQVAKALQYTHNEKNGGIIHRDIKLANILLLQDNSIKLMDFGISSNTNTTSDSVGGTLQYLSPELLKGDPIDGRVDIYALGIVAYFMLACKPPFKITNMQSAIQHHLLETPPAIELTVPSVTPNLIEFITKAMVKNPEDRIFNYDEIIHLLSDEASINEPYDARLHLHFEQKNVKLESLIRDIEKLLHKHKIPNTVALELKEGNYWIEK